MPVVRLTVSLTGGTAVGVEAPPPPPPPLDAGLRSPAEDSDLDPSDLAGFESGASDGWRCPAAGRGPFGGVRRAGGPASRRRSRCAVLSRLRSRGRALVAFVVVGGGGAGRLLRGGRDLAARVAVGHRLGCDGRRPDLGGPVARRGRRRDLADAGAGADPGDQDGGAGGGLPPTAGQVIGEHRQLRRPLRAATRGWQRRGIGGAAAELDERRERQQTRDARGDPLAHGRTREQLAVQPGGERLAAAALAVREVAGEPARVAQAQRRLRGGDDDALDALAAGAGDDVVVLLGQAAAGAEERRLDGRAAHAHPLADLLVAQALELAQDEDLVVGLAEPAERAAEVVEVLLGLDGGVRRGPGADQLGVIGGRERVVGVVGDLLGALGAAEGVDAAVLGDLVEPGLEGQRLLGLAHAAQRGDEDLLGDVLGAAVVLDHPEYVRMDPALIALVEELEGTVVAAPDRSDQTLVGVRGASRIPGRRRCGAGHSPTHCFRVLSRCSSNRSGP